MRGRAISLALVLCLSAGLAACATPPPKEEMPADEALESQKSLARFALQSGNYDQAELLYEKALAQAYERDDVRAIGNLGYELALTRLRNQKPAEAAEQARRTQAELLRRQQDPFAELYLVEAAAEYESQRLPRARQAAERTLADSAPNALEARGRAHFILGLIAADTGDTGGLASAIAALGNAQEPDLRADRHELQGRADLMAGRPEEARPDFEAAAAIRQIMMSYDGMARALSLAGMASERMGEPDKAADYYFRAGRSALQRGDVDKARPWLDRAIALAADDPRQADLTREAGELLQQLEEAHGS